MRPPEDPSEKGAYALWRAIRAHDATVSAVEREACELVEGWTSYTPINVGSFGLRLNLDASDIDLAIGVPDTDLARVLKRLASEVTFKAERQTTPTTTRHVFVTEIANTEIDIGVLKQRDFALLAEGLERCRRSMTEHERVMHTYQKHLLREAGDTAAYAKLKLEPYERFCPGFSWTPIP